MMFRNFSNGAARLDRTFPTTQWRFTAQLRNDNAGSVPRLARVSSAPKVMHMKPETLAHKLGTTALVSPLLMKAWRLGLHYIAECDVKFEPANAFWSELLARLPVTPPPKDGIMPLPTRFVAMNGFERGIGKKIATEWQRPQRSAA